MIELQFNIKSFYIDENKKYLAFIEYENQKIKFIEGLKLYDVLEYIWNEYSLQDSINKDSRYMKYDLDVVDYNVFFLETIF